MPATIAELDELTRRHSNARSFNQLVNDPANLYRPTLYCLRKTRQDRERRILADAYDAAQEERGDPRRIYRS